MDHRTTTTTAGRNAGEGSGHEAAVVPAANVPPSALGFLGLQHVLVMYAGAVAVPLIVGRALQLSPEEVALLVSADLFACGIATLVRSWGVPRVGIRMPVTMGIPFAAVSPMIAMGTNPAIGLVGVTSVRSRWDTVVGGFIMLGLGLIPKVAALVEAVPQCVLAGAGLVRLGMVAATGALILGAIIPTTATTRSCSRWGSA